jgi:hypothetical protein
VDQFDLWIPNGFTPFVVNPNCTLQGSMVKFGQELPQNSIGANLLDVEPTHLGCNCGDATPSTLFG